MCGLSAPTSGWIRLALLLCIRFKGDRGSSFLGSLGRPFRLCLPKPRADPNSGDLPADPAFPGPHEAVDSTLGSQKKSRAGATLPEGRVVLEQTAARPFAG